MIEPAVGLGVRQPVGLVGKAAYAVVRRFGHVALNRLQRRRDAVAFRQLRRGRFQATEQVG